MGLNLKLDTIQYDNKHNLCSSMIHCPEFLRLLTHATFFEAAIALRMSLSDVVHRAELHVQLRIRTAFAVALSKFW